MFLKFDSVDGIHQGIEMAATEICTFEGIRYDAELNLAILSTEHSAHDYLMPMTHENYAGFVETLYTMAAMSLMRPGLMILIQGSPLIRVKHGSAAQSDGTGEHQYKYSLEVDKSVVEGMGILN